MFYALLTAFTLVAFAANSILCRMALGAHLIDPVSFSTLRLLSGAIVLVPLSRLAGKSRAAKRSPGSWTSGLALFVYALAFSLAYISLQAGIGALILFGAVQATMIGVGIVSGEQPHASEWLGLFTALGGLVYLVAPGVTSPDPLGALLMSISGIAWGAYSLRGKGALAPVSSTAGNFVRALPMAAVASVFALSSVDAHAAGVILAVISGSVTSGLGYVLWYRALRGLTTAQAAIVQLLVPILAGFGGIVFLGERPSVRLAIASALILGGVAMAVRGRTSKCRPPVRV
jgi:drug/metabolite transporter (DMT)-like permease